MSILYIVATPIGNLEDMTHRAVRILGEVDMVYCEDTRTTKKLLDHYGVLAKTKSYNAHASDSKHSEIIELLREGKDVALVSDAGTPTISDPGVKIVEQVYTEFPNGEVQVVAVPGASALMSALSISGVSSAEFIFLGFLPHKKGRETKFKEIAESTKTIAFYESPHRIEKTLASLTEVLGEKREVVIARELTKLHEQVVQGSATEVQQYFAENQDKVRGEFVVIVGS